MNYRVYSVIHFVLSFQLFIINCLSEFPFSALSNLAPLSPVCLTANTANKWREYVWNTRDGRFAWKIKYFNQFVSFGMSLFCSNAKNDNMSCTSASYALCSQTIDRCVMWILRINNWASMTDKLSLISFGCMTNVLGAIVIARMSHGHDVRTKWIHSHWFIAHSCSWERRAYITKH